MNTIKNFLSLFLFVALAATFNTTTVSAQAASPKAEFVIHAGEVDHTVGLLLPAVQRVREAAYRASLEKLLKETRAIAQKVARAGANMTDAQFAQFTREFEANDQAYAAWTRTLSTRHRSVQDCIQYCIDHSNSSYQRRICIQDCIGSWITLQVNPTGN